MKTVLLIAVAALFLAFSILAGTHHPLAASGALLAGFLLGAGLATNPRDSPAPDREHAADE